MQNVLELRPKILEFIKRNGPVLPVQISKEIGSNILFAGAVLSELVATKKVLISNAKIGGSPVYYVHGQEFKLSTLYSHLIEVHRKVFDLLKEKKVLQDVVLEPWQRVALRELKDFAVMLKTNNEEIFWRWYLIPNHEAEPLIKQILGIEEKEEIKEEIIELPVKIEKPEEIKEEVVEQKLPIKKHQEKKEIIEKPKVIHIALDPKGFFADNNIKILEEKIIRKKNIEYIALIPSKIGEVRFFIKFIDKKKISDEDLKLAYYEAKEKNLPLLFLTTGEPTKKGIEYLKNKDIQIKSLKEKP